MTGPTKTVKPKAKTEPLTVASNDDILAEMVKHTSLLASINELKKLERKQAGYDLTVTEGSII
jgi:hypothetical protein